VTRFSISWGDEAGRSEGTQPETMESTVENGAAESQPMEGEWVLDSQNSINSLPTPTAMV